MYSKIIDGSNNISTSAVISKLFSSATITPTTTVATAKLWTGGTQEDQNYRQQQQK
jgi:hypothetical protein